MGKEKPGDDFFKKLVIAVPLILVAGGLFYFGFSGENRPSAISSSKKVNSDVPGASSIVNKHLQLTARQIEIEQLKREAENHGLLNRNVEKGLNQPNYRDHYKPSLVDVAEQNNSNGSVNPSLDLSPSSIIMNELAETQDHNRELEEYREEYKRQYIENARRQGYKVEIDDDFVIRKVYPIHNPNNQGPSIFDEENLSRSASGR